jgi:hypothetical protein
MGRGDPGGSFPNIVLGCMRRLRAGRDSHLLAGADLDGFGISYDYFGSVRVLQIRALISSESGRHAESGGGMALRGWSLRGEGAATGAINQYLAALSGVISPTGTAVY